MKIPTYFRKNSGIGYYPSTILIYKIIYLSRFMYIYLDNAE